MKNKKKIYNSFRSYQNNIDKEMKPKINVQYSPWILDMFPMPQCPINYTILTKLRY